jgi:hypothetical protein
MLYKYKNFLKFNCIIILNLLNVKKNKYLKILNILFDDEDFIY